MPTDAIFGMQDLLQRRNIPNVIKNLDALASVTVSNEYYFFKFILIIVFIFIYYCYYFLLLSFFTIRFFFLLVYLFIF